MKMNETSLNGDIIAANAGDCSLVEITSNGNQVGVKTVEPAGAGALFALTSAPTTQASTS
jgi:hypothetical protein